MSRQVVHRQKTYAQLVTSGIKDHAYRKIGILITGALFSRGTYFHGMLINASNFLCGNGLAVYILGVEVLFLLIFIQC